MELSNEIAALLAQTHEILELSKSDDEDAQDRLEALLNARQAALQAFFSKSNASETGAQIDAMIETILKSDAESIQQIETHKNCIAKIIKQMRQGRRALKAYGN